MNTPTLDRMLECWLKIITVITANSLGFKNPRKSTNKDIIISLQNRHRIMKII